MPSDDTGARPASASKQFRFILLTVMAFEFKFDMETMVKGKGDRRLYYAELEVSGYMRSGWGHNDIETTMMH